MTDAELEQEARELLAHLNSVPFAHEYRMEGETFGQILDVLRRLIDDRTTLRARIAELEACIDLVIPDDCKSQLHEDATNMVKLQARVAELEADRAEWVEVERLRMGKV